MGFQPVQNHAYMVAHGELRCKTGKGVNTATFHGYKVVVGRGEKSRPFGFNANDAHHIGMADLLHGVGERAELAGPGGGVFLRRHQNVVGGDHAAYGRRRLATDQDDAEEHSAALASQVEDEQVGAVQRRRVIYAEQQHAAVIVCYQQRVTEIGHLRDAADAERILRRIEVEHDVVAFPRARQRDKRKVVSTGSTDQDVVTRMAAENVVATPAEQAVVAAVAGKHIAMPGTKNKHLQTPRLAP